MSQKREKNGDSDESPGTPKYIVSYSAMMTILLAFFIMLQNLSSVREYGLLGIGLGAFRQSFNSIGLPGLLPGSGKTLSLNAPGGKYVPEGKGEDGEEAMEEDARMIEPGDRDLADTVTDALDARDNVVVHLALRRSDRLDEKAKKELATLARLIRATDCAVLVSAELPPSTGQTSHPWYKACQLALLVGRHLCLAENVPSHRVTAVGKVAKSGSDAEKSEKPRGPIVRLVLRPASKRLAVRGVKARR